MDSSLFNLESESGTDHMEALDSSSAWIDYQHISPLRISDHFQYVRMPAYEYIRTALVYKLESLGIISSRIASDMGHKHLKALALEKSVERMLEPQIMIVAIACHSDKRLESGYLCRQVQPASEVSGMPDLVDRLKELFDPPVKHTMSIRYEPDIHGYSLMNIFFL